MRASYVTMLLFWSYLFYPLHVFFVPFAPNQLLIDSSSLVLENAN